MTAPSTFLILLLSEMIPSSLPVFEISLGVVFGILVFSVLLMAMLFMVYLRRKNIRYMSINQMQNDTLIPWFEIRIQSCCDSSDNYNTIISQL